MEIYVKIKKYFCKHRSMYLLVHHLNKLTSGSLCQKIFLNFAETEPSLCYLVTITLPDWWVILQKQLKILLPIESIFS